jgi:hypothetical protein
MRNQEAPPTDDRRLVQRAGFVLPVAVWVLGLVSPPPKGLSLDYVVTYSLLLAATALVDQTAPPQTAPVGHRLAWLLAEIVLCGLVVRTQGTLIRPALIYLLLVGRGILLLGERGGLPGPGLLGRFLRAHVVAEARCHVRVIPPGIRFGHSQPAIAGEFRIFRLGRGGGLPVTTNATVRDNQYILRAMQVFWLL